MTFPRIKKDGPNNGFWWTKDRIAKAIKKAVAFGPVDVLSAKAINSGNQFPPAKKRTT